MKTKNGKPLRLVLLTGLMLFIFAAFTGTAGAATATFSDINMIGTQIAIYEVNETGSHLIGIYNSTDSGVTIPDNAIIVFKPANVDYFKNPGQIPAFLLALLPAWANYVVILIVVGVVGYVFLRRR